MKVAEYIATRQPFTVGDLRFEVHYGGKDWWGTLSWLPQIRGGGEKYPGQTNANLHLIEKTKQEIRLKIGFNF